MVLAQAVSSKWFIDMLKQSREDSSDGLVFKDKEIDANLGGNAAGVLNL